MSNRKSGRTFWDIVSEQANTPADYAFLLLGGASGFSIDILLAGGSGGTGSVGGALGFLGLKKAYDAKVIFRSKKSLRKECEEWVIYFSEGINEDAQRADEFKEIIRMIDTVKKLPKAEVANRLNKLKSEYNIP